MAEKILRKRISTGELERRWRAVRQAMEENKLDFLIFQNAIPTLNGYIRWFTDVPVAGNPATVIFPREEGMTTIWHGPRPPADPKPPAPFLHGVKKRISVPIIPALGYSSTFDAEKVVEELAPYGKCRIGLVGMGFISAALYKYVTEHLTQAVFEDATNLVDAIKAIKSDEEINLIKEACKIQDDIFSFVLTIVQPGKRNHEIYTDVIHKCLQMGCEQTNILVGSAPAGTAATFGPLAFMVNRVIEKGDQFGILIETNGPGGFWGELSRIICLGKPSPELEQQVELARKAKQVTLGFLKPGSDPAAIWNANNDFMRSTGYPEERRIYAHGQGYDMVERPSLDPGETMKLQARMNISVHPTVSSPKAFVSLTENYLISQSGEAECLHKTPEKVFITL